MIIKEISCLTFTGEESVRESKLDATQKDKQFTIHMPGAQPFKKDDYLCSAFTMKNLMQASERKKFFITGFNVDANSTNVGHVAISRCNKASIEEGKVYSCLNTEEAGESVCGSSYDWYELIYDWGHDGGPMKLPTDAGFEVDGEDDHLIMQVHYKVPLDFKDKTSILITYTEDKPKYSAGLELLALDDLAIPSGKSNFQADMSCKVCDKLQFQISRNIFFC